MLRCNSFIKFRALLRTLKSFISFRSPSSAANYGSDPVAHTMLDTAKTVFGRIFNMTTDIAFHINKKFGEIKIPLPNYMEKHSLPNGPISRDLLEGFASIACTGEDNVLYRGQNVKCKKLAIKIKGKKNKIFIGSNTDLRGVIDIVGANITVFIGANTTFNSVRMYCKGWTHAVYIGRDCMFSSDIEIRTSDSHSVIDLDSMTTTNHPDGVFIGDHVWVSKNVFIQKGSTIGHDNIIGFGSMVNGDLSASNSIIVGRPAKAVPNRRVSWSRKGELQIVDESIFDWKSFPLL